ncbi:hypothetical protein SAMN04488245_10319 [Alloyangia pacifica]|uniref:Uncharacterized protein n=1 Tax=Alloyangia pacifica TaxID=311180 RepID=A0A1I6RDW2_9RHOB|nr:hypothetical protein SAMN04488245_10319 [Alloyangia pacifica]SFS62864.1 hypothetical protein SAMN04488050_10319 [Alloyangia pacifica]
MARESPDWRPGSPVHAARGLQLCIVPPKASARCARDPDRLDACLLEAQRRWWDHERNGTAFRRQALRQESSPRDKVSTAAAVLVGRPVIVVGWERWAQANVDPRVIRGPANGSPCPRSPLSSPRPASRPLTCTGNSGLWGGKVKCRPEALLCGGGICARRRARRNATTQRLLGPQAQPTPFFSLKIRPPEAVLPVPPAQRSEGWFTPSDQAIGSCSAGFTPSMPPMFTPNSFGFERRRWYM